MKIEDVTSTLEERGVLWQAVGFGLLGVVALTLLSVYSDSNEWVIETYRLGMTQLSWAFIAIIAVGIEGARKMFETRTEIRRAAREKAMAKAREEGVEEGVEIGREQGREEGVEIGVSQGREEGREEGIELGVEQGVEIGVRQGKEEVLSKLREYGIELPKDAEEDIFRSNHHDK